MQTYILTSERVPQDLLILSQQDSPIGPPGFNFQIVESFGQKLRQSDKWSFEGLKVTPATRYVALMRGDGTNFAGDDYEWGLIGEIRKTRPYEVTVICPDGTELGPYHEEEGGCPHVWPPEMFGLKRHPWWKGWFD